MDSFITPIISAGISALVSYYVTIYTKDREYKNEYYKKVIDKRIAAYEKVEKVLNSLYFTSGDDKTSRFAIFNKKEDYTSFSITVSDAIKSSMWLTVDSKRFLYAINQNLVDAGRGKNYDDAEQLKLAGISTYESLNHNKSYLESYLRRDMFHLHNVTRFFGSRN